MDQIEAEFVQGKIHAMFVSRLPKVFRERSLLEGCEVATIDQRKSFRANRMDVRNLKKKSIDINR
jgi:hypothetical protein